MPSKVIIQRYHLPWKYKNDPIEGKETEMFDEDEEAKRMIDVITYIVSLTESARRFSKGMPPFDFGDLSTVEFMVNSNMPFIEDKDITYRKAHELFLMYMIDDGWKLGPEDFESRTHPDLVPYDKLPEEAKERIAFRAAVICSAREFYESFKKDLEQTIIQKDLGILGSTYIRTTLYH